MSAHVFNEFIMLVGENRYNASLAEQLIPFSQRVE